MNIKEWDWSILTTVFIVVSFWVWVLVLLNAS